MSDITYRLRDSACDDDNAVMMLAADEIDMLRAVIATLERLARDGHGPVFTQTSVGTAKTFCGIGKTTDDFCAAIVALGRMSE